MNFFALPPIVTFFLIAGEGYFVWKQNPRSLQNILYGLFCASLCVWLAGFSMMYLSASADRALFWARSGFVGIIFIPVLAYHFVCSLIEVRKDNVLVFLYVTTIPSLLLFPTRLVYSGVSYSFWGYYPTAGILYLFFLMCFLVGFSGSIIRLIFEFLSQKKDLPPSKRKQYICLLIAFGIGTTGLVDYLIKLPFFEIYPWGYVSAFGLITFFALAVIRYRLLDIEIVIKKTVIFAGLFVFFFTVFGAIAFVISQFFETLLVHRWAAIIPTFIVIILSYRPIENFLIRITDNYLFQKRYDYKDLLKAFTGEVLTVLDLKNMTELTVEKLTDIMKLENAHFFVLNKEKKFFQLAASSEENVEIGSKWLESGELKGRIFDQNTCFIIGSGNLPGNIKGYVKTYDTSILVPIMRNDEILGMLSLGKKKSDEDFMESDIDSLMSVVATLGLAIKNAKYIDELNRSYLELLESQKREQRAENLVSLGYMVTNLSHELRNPVHVISASVEELLDVIDMDMELDDLSTKQRKTMEYVKSKLEKTLERSDKTHAMLESILNAIKVTPEKFIDTNLWEMVEEVISRVGSYAQNAESRIYNKVPEDFPLIRVDRVTFEQVLVNLITNAIQAFQVSQKGDTITVEATIVNELIRIEVADNGPGIPEEDITRIFEPFYTTKDNLHVYKNGKNSGTGLGLMITRQTISNHKGSIKVESVVGEGTTFIIEIPGTSEGGN